MKIMSEESRSEVEQSLQQRIQGGWNLHRPAKITLSQREKALLTAIEDGQPHTVEEINAAIGSTPKASQEPRAIALRIRSYLRFARNVRLAHHPAPRRALPNGGFQGQHRTPSTLQGARLECRGGSGQDSRAGVLCVWCFWEG